ncbi:hypothetical protein [Ahrensia sp. R2A130]|uniref:HalD/BesD family halogenase n=1 Tax=Ahrensia sp. R2A130 TaxID=744979 RepID=UPI0001E0E0AC|nr:hypothetical protein [Ahrensia sp. R2A130]EFL89336.1 conserved hypothetical protein [Ahrensia sp. R2A130]
MNFDQIINIATHPLDDQAFQNACRKVLDDNGVLVLPGFLTAHALSELQQEARDGQDKAYFCAQNHNVYLTDADPAFDANHPRNREVVSSKGCICDDDVAADSPLRGLYDAQRFRDFVMAVTGEQELHPYADPLSSINIHYANRGQELGWHFDNSSFAITLLIEKPDGGSRFEYMKDTRDASRQKEGDAETHARLADLLDGRAAPDVLEMEPGTLVLFRGRNAIHRVSPNESDKTRMLAVLAYNAEAGVSLSESARMTFYGRLS